MTYKRNLNYRKVSIIASFLLLLHPAHAQDKFAKVDSWLKDNLSELGGRAVLQVYKGGKIVYSRSENSLTSRQKMIGKFIAKRQGKDASEMLKDFTSSSQELIASSSK